MRGNNHGGSGGFFPPMGVWGQRPQWGFRGQRPLPLIVALWEAPPPTPPAKGGNPLWKPVIRYLGFISYQNVVQRVKFSVPIFSSVRIIMGGSGAGYGVSPFSNPPDGGLGAEPPMGVQGVKPPAPYRSTKKPPISHFLKIFYTDILTVVKGVFGDLRFFRNSDFFKPFAAKKRTVTNHRHTLGEVYIFKALTALKGTLTDFL